MKEIERYIEELGLMQQIQLEDIPSIDLYMDQVIQLFENKYGQTKRNEDEKLLTKTMINNYAKDKLFLPIKNKKYSREHVILISLIFQLKGGLSIGDIKQSLKGLNEQVIDNRVNLEEVYKSYLELALNNIDSFKVDVNKHVNEVQEVSKNLDSEEKEYLEQILLIVSLINMSNHYRRTAEKLVDQLTKK